MTPFGIGAFTATIIVGRISGHVSNRVLIIISCLLFGYSSFALGNINLQVAPANLLWPIIISGVGASSMYVPVATAAMERSAANKWATLLHFQFDAQHRWSIGIASITTLVTRHTQASQADLVWHMSKFNFNFQQQLAHLQSALASHTGNWAATKKSLAFSMASSTTKFASQLRLRISFLRIGLPGLCGTRTSVQEQSANQPAPSRPIDDVGGLTNERHIRTNQQ